MFYLVRHGEIQSNIDKVYAGWSDEALTDVGMRQAERAGEALKSKGIGALYCSPLKRTAQTAEIIGEAIGLVPVADGHFKEMKMGPWEGLSEDEIARRFAKEWRNWNTQPAVLRLEGRETLAELQERVLDGVRELATKEQGLTQRRKGAKRVAVVTHVAIIRVMLLYVEGRELNDYKKVPVVNGGIFEIGDELLSY